MKKIYLFACLFFGIQCTAQINGNISIRENTVEPASSNLKSNKALVSKPKQKEFSFWQPAAGGFWQFQDSTYYFYDNIANVEIEKIIASTGDYRKLRTFDVLGNRLVEKWQKYDVFTSSWLNHFSGGSIDSITRDPQGNYTNWRVSNSDGISTFTIFSDQYASYSYNTNNLKTMQKRWGYDPVYNGNIDSITFAYDANSNLTEIVQYVADPANNLLWKPSVKIVQTFVSNKLYSYESFDWLAGSWDQLDKTIFQSWSVWNGPYSEQYPDFNNGQRELDSVLYLTGNGDTLGKRIYTWFPNNSYEEKTYDYVAINQFEPTNKRVVSNDIENNEISDAFYNYVGGTYQLTSDNKNIYVYDGIGNPISLIWQLYNSTLSQYENQTKTIYDDYLLLNNNVTISENNVDFTFYPIPAKDRLNVSCLTNTISDVDLFDLQGKRIDLPFDNNQLDISSLPIGNYIVQLSFDNGLIENKRFVKY